MWRRLSSDDDERWKVIRVRIPSSPETKRGRVGGCDPLRYVISESHFEKISRSEGRDIVGHRHNIDVN